MMRAYVALPLLVLACLAIPIAFEEWLQRRETRRVVREIEEHLQQRAGRKRS